MSCRLNNNPFHPFTAVVPFLNQRKDGVVLINEQRKEFFIPIQNPNHILMACEAQSKQTRQNKFKPIIMSESALCTNSLLMR